MEIEKNNNIFSNSLKAAKTSWKQKAVAAAIVLVLLICGISVSYFLLQNKPKARKRHALITKTLVEVTRVRKSNVPVTFSVFGKVISSREIRLTPQISGRVKGVHKNFRPGGLIRKGEIVVTLENSDYKSALEHKRAVLEQVMADLRMEEGKQNVARNEWEEYRKIKDSVKYINPDLILRQPQLRKAKAVVDAARADLSKAELDYSRTEIKAPFDSMVRSKNVDVGSQVTTQSEMGILTGTSAYWVEIAIPVDRLKWLKVTGDADKRSQVTIYSADRTKFEARILSLFGEIEKNGLMAKILIEVKNPVMNRQAPLLLESFVKTELRGVILENVYRIPRTALSENNTIFVANKDNTLDIRIPKVKWKDTQWVYISEGLNDDDLMITTSISAPIKGMPIEILTRKKVKKRVRIKRLKDSDKDKEEE